MKLLETLQLVPGSSALCIAKVGVSLSGVALAPSPTFLSLVATRRFSTSWGCWIWFERSLRVTLRKSLFISRRTSLSVLYIKPSWPCRWLMAGLCIWLSLPFTSASDIGGLAWGQDFCDSPCLSSCSLFHGAFFVACFRGHRLLFVATHRAFSYHSHFNLHDEARLQLSDASPCRILPSVLSWLVYALLFMVWLLPRVVLARLISGIQIFWCHFLLGSVKLCRKCALWESCMIRVSTWL